MFEKRKEKKRIFFCPSYNLVQGNVGKKSQFPGESSLGKIAFALSECGSIRLENWPHRETRLIPPVIPIRLNNCLRRLGALLLIHLQHKQKRDQHRGGIQRPIQHGLHGGETAPGVQALVSGILFRIWQLKGIVIARALYVDSAATPRHHRRCHATVQLSVPETGFLRVESFPHVQSTLSLSLSLSLSRSFTFLFLIFVSTVSLRYLNVNVLPRTMLQETSVQMDEGMNGRTELFLNALAFYFF